MIVHERLTGWIKRTKKPKYRGSYEGKDASGQITKFFFDLGDSVPPGLTHWRGQYTRLKSKAKGVHQETLRSFKADLAGRASSGEVAMAAIRLARHYAGPGKGRRGNFFKACKLLRVAERLGAPFEQSDKDYLESRWAKLDGSKRQKIADSVSTFIGSLGALSTGQ